MKISLADILRATLLNKKIKLFKVVQDNNLEYYLVDEDNLIGRAKIIGEDVGIIKSIEVDEIAHEGDWYNFEIINSLGEVLNVDGLSSITSKLQIIE